MKVIIMLIYNIKKKSKNYYLYHLIGLIDKKKFIPVVFSKSIIHKSIPINKFFNIVSLMNNYFNI